ncbi:MAG: AAA family ATPase [Proteobacteria bacterium]|nr:AAA family ATPase [Pseudomonadota bacterium]
MSSLPQSHNAFEQGQQRLRSLCEALSGVIVGQQATIEALVIAFFAGGHVLLEGLPGLGKTHLVKALGSLLGLTTGRIQCTPDLMPADITGSEVVGRTGSEGLVFRKGPVFTQLLLVDEINRATPRTQAALLEAMQERQVTCFGTSHALPAPFTVIATQNPIELEGTFPLPEAQLDRFLFKLQVGYPDAGALQALLAISLDAEPALTLQCMFTAAEVDEVMALCRSVLIATDCKRAAVDLVLATQPGAAAASELARRHLRYGASPRALQALIRAARVRAVLAGRAHVDMDDLAEVALPVLRHRVLLKVESELDGITADDLLRDLVAQWRSRA